MLNAKLGINEGETLEDKLSDMLKAKLGIVETLDTRLGIEEDETQDVKLNDMLNAKLGLRVGQTLDAKLGLEKHGRVDLPNIERQMKQL
jgi:hypothetical protein